MIYTILILIGAAAICVFTYFKNKQANRHEDQRARFWEKQQQLLEQLRKPNEADDGNGK